MFGRKKRKQKLLTEEEIQEKFKDVELEDSDVTAMIIAALITFVPVLLLMLFAIYGILWFIFLR